MTRRDRAQLNGLLQVAVFLVGTILALWFLTLLYGALLKPIAEIALNMEAVQDTGRAGQVERVMNIIPFAGLLLGVGAILLAIIFAVFREQFIGRTGRRVRRP